MCGIAGWFSPRENSDQHRSQLQKMVAAIAHRGPDGRGTVINAHAALGHARLAIIDLQRGVQPLTTPQGDLTVSFNGEIYNYKELKHGLERRGYRFATESDTEVILALYAQDGVAGFARMRGMYAFALWDGRKREGLLVRDPLGIKPLFVAKRRDGDVVFASEAKAILPRISERAELDEGSLHLLMNLRYVPGERTLFRGIEQLGPGRVLRWQVDGSVTEGSLAEPPQGESSSVLDALTESVKLHFTSDVEVAAYLSGGFDSAAIVAIARRLGHTGLRTFTLNVGDDPGEAANAERTAELLGVQNIRGDYNPDISQCLPRLVWHLEVPKINALQVSELAKHASRHVKVALSGLGGDEVFLGYNIHRWLALSGAWHRVVPLAVSSSAGTYAANVFKRVSGLPWTEPERAFRALSRFGEWPRVYAILRNVWDDEVLRKEIYGPRMLDAALPDAFEAVQRMWPSEPDPVEATADYEWRNKMVNDLLWQEDRCSMAEGLEVRVPYLDICFASRVRAMGRERLMPGGQRKGMMRKVLQELLPAEVLARPKSGFQVDAPKFFQMHLAQLADTVLSEDRIRHYELFNWAFVQKVRRSGTGRVLRWHYFILYLMLGTHLWMDAFEEGQSASAYR